MASKQDSPKRNKQKRRATKKLEKWREKQANAGDDKAPKKPAAKKG
jgi:hypothetical protein